jgi:hypothetical protein
MAEKMNGCNKDSDEFNDICEKEDMTGENI